jgi:predicted Zn finger-like uncharacterized protein
MNVSCPDCRSIFRVDPAKVPPSGVRARCSVCSGVIAIPAPSLSSPAGGTMRAPTPPTPVQRTAPQPTPPAPVSPRPPAPPATPLSPRAPESFAAPRPAAQETPARGPATATATPPSPSAGVPDRAPPPPFGAPSTPPFTAPLAAANATPSAPPYIPSAPPARPVSAPSPVSPPAAATPVGDAGARRPVNPFLSKDPNQRAKRLARALVSDIITYHPAKHAEGLRDGTLKQLFREEIKKSFEEYIAQVGQQLAESTTYFQEALNEVLAAGKKIF